LKNNFSFSWGTFCNEGWHGAYAPLPHCLPAANECPQTPQKLSQHFLLRESFYFFGRTLGTADRILPLPKRFGGFWGRNF